MFELTGIAAPARNKWWKEPSVTEESRNTLLSYHEYRVMIMCEKCLKLDSQFDAVASLLKTYRKVFFAEDMDSVICLCHLLEHGIHGKRKKRLINMIDKIGFENIQNSFQVLMQVCENGYREKEDLFMILKKHRLNFPKPGSDREKLYRIGQFLNIALINRNLMKKGIVKTTEKLLKKKYDAAVVIMPLIDEIFLAVFGKAELAA